ncbi:hypothetical protein KY289_007811 [Solanum tuberosum]|nr:hypothetical protein KY289_007811 [Solanum tuberosum]
MFESNCETLGSDRLQRFAPESGRNSFQGSGLTQHSSNINIEVFFPTATSVHFDFWEGECSANLGGDDGISHCDTAGCRDWGLNCSSKTDLLSQNCRGNTYYSRSSSREQIDRMGLTLDYYPLVVKDGHKVATLNPKEIQEESQKWMVSLFGYVVGGNPTSTIILGKITKSLTSICRTFLWTGSCEISRKALIAWERLCMPRTAGGLNLIDYHIWNKAAILKVLWAVASKKETLWVQWIHGFYIRDRPIESVPIPRQAC